MDLSQRYIAACGIDCTDCDIRNITCDAGAAQRITDWFHKMGWIKADEGLNEIVQRGMYCKGCRGDRSVHWSADCEILKCCVDEKGLTNCSECADFPCQRLTEWAATGQKYTNALNRLHQIKAKRSAN